MPTLKAKPVEPRLQLELKRVYHGSISKTRPKRRLKKIMTTTKTENLESMARYALSKITIARNEIEARLGFIP